MGAEMIPATPALVTPNFVICTSSTRPASPYAGLTIYETNTGNTLVYQSATTGWTAPWNTSWGQVGYAEATGAQNSFGPAITDITNATVTFTAISTRNYLFMGSANILQNTAAGIVHLSLTNSSNTVVQQPGTSIAANSYMDFTIMKQITGLSGSVTYKLRGDSTAGTISMNQGATVPTTITVLDVGPSAVPA